MTPGQQVLMSGLIPSVLVILSWLHNNTRLSRLESGQDATNRRLESGQDAMNRRLESGQDATNRRLDELVKNFHSDMMSFQASVLEANYQVRERVTRIESKTA